VSLAVTVKRCKLVLMRLSDKYDVPQELALLYDFVNSLDQRRYVESGVAHAGGDQIATRRLFETWMAERGMLPRGSRVTSGEHAAALELRSAIRDLLRISPTRRSLAHNEAHRLNSISAKFPLTLQVAENGAAELLPAPKSSALGKVLGQMLTLAQTDRLTRLKTCASDECYWIFFDRSKPANRHWCSSSRCGNRHKTRAYRARQSSQPRSNR
jgi:predicted RNA-binding Zn ribbon-like protein